MTPTFRRFAASLSLVLASIAPAQRVDNETLTLPAALPVGAYELAPYRQGAIVLAFATPPGETARLFLAERDGRIRIVNNLPTGGALPTPFLDISSRVATNLENGLLGLAFHPDYASNRQFFVFYTTNASGNATNRVSRFLRSANDPDRADPTSETILFDQIDGAANHNGGDIHFGPDGYLYVSLGDEGGANDTFNNSQRVDRDFFAGMLRIDVDKRPGNLEPTAHPAIPRNGSGQAAFSVPADNPLAPIWQGAGSNPQSPLRLEFYAIGLRNGWRFSFDAPTGALWLADVGQGQREEVNLIQKGGNYGWAFREGSLGGPKTQTPPAGFTTLVNPIHEYAHPGGGASITGGRVYRGSHLPELYGAYVFGDYVSGRIFILMPDPDGGAPTATQIATNPATMAFGVDPSNGDILVSSGSGAIRRLVRGDGGAQPDFPANLSDTGAFQNLNTLEPEDGIYAYEPNLPFWSDYADKRRWASIPAGESIGFEPDAPWDFPAGSVWIKHFEIETTRGDPTTRRRLETRFLVKTDQGAYGISYRWNDAQTEATLAPEEGVSFDLDIVENGQPRTQTWTIPSRADCLACHTDAAGFILSFDTRQLNRDFSHDGAERNTLAYLAAIGILDTPIDDGEAASLPRHYRPEEIGVGLERRARSYLAVNCAMCHQPGASGAGSWDGRASISLAETGLIDGDALDDGGDPTRRLVTLGHSERSILIDRMAERKGFGRMPPIGSSEIDRIGVALLATWIDLTPWQIEHWGDAEDPDALPDADPDRDGADNRFEYLTGTDPRNGASLWTPELRFENGATRIDLPEIEGRRFSVERSADLTDWDALAEDEEAPLPEADAPVFLRVKVEKAEE